MRTADSSPATPGESFVSIYSLNSFPVSEQVMIEDYGPVAAQEITTYPEFFLPAADLPGTPIRVRSSLLRALARADARPVWVSCGCTWPVGRDDLRIDPEFAQVATRRDGSTLYFHPSDTGQRIFRCRETNRYFTTRDGLIYIEDVGEYVYRGWMETNDNDGYFHCECCNNWYTDDEPEEDGECRSCADNHRDDYDDDDDDDDDDSALIRDYSSRSYPAARGPHPRKYGVEMEVEVAGDISRRARTVLDHCADAAGEFVILKSDGSLNHGFEIVSAPMDFDAHMTRWHAYFEHGTDGLKAWDTGTCGLHIHVTRAELSMLQLGKMIVFVNDPRHRDFIQLVAGRDPSRWAKLQPSWKHGYAGRRDNDRYSAVNLNRSETVEFRIFRGTVKESTFYKALQFVDALVEYCGPCERSIAQTNNLDNFLKFIREHRKRYPHLDDFLVAKGKLPARKVAKNSSPTPALVEA